MTRSRASSAEIAETADSLSKSMLLKLEENSHKPHWLDESLSDLVKMLDLEVEELKESLINQNDENSMLECADIANFCMFIHSKIERIIENKKNQLL